MRWVTIGGLCLCIIGAAGGGVSYAETDGDTLTAKVEHLERLLEGREQELAELKATVANLNDRMRTLQQPTAPPLEPAEELKRVTEYVCQKGHLYQELPVDGRCPVDGTLLSLRQTYKKVKLSRRESVAEKVEAAIEGALAERIVVGTSMTGTVQHSLGGTDDRTAGVGSADLIIAGRPAPSMILFADLEAIGGNGLDAVLGTNSKLNEDAGSLQDSDKVDRVSVREAWLQWNSLEQHWSASAGKIDLTNYFDSNLVANDETTQFLASAFVKNPVFAQPPNGPGAVLQFDSREAFRWGIGVQSADDSGDRLFHELYGVTELGLHTNAVFGRPGNYRLWGRINGGADDDNMAMGISLDQQVLPQWTLFGRYGLAEEEGSSVNYAWSVGVEQRAPWKRRPQDRWAVAVGQQDGTTASRDGLVEWYYRFVVSPHLALSPHVQWLIESAGNSTSEPQENVFVIGIRNQVSF